MTFFEYLAIAYSLIISIAVSRVLGGISAALFSEKRYWIHLAYVVWILGSSLMVFWNFWLFREVEWTLPRYILVLANPALLLVLAAQIMPTESLTSMCWRTHFYRVRQGLCLTAALWLLVINVSSVYLSALPLLHPARWASSLFVLLFVLGALSAKPALHASIAVLNLASLALMIVSVFAPPGGGPG